MNKGKKMARLAVAPEQNKAKTKNEAKQLQIILCVHQTSPNCKFGACASSWKPQRKIAA
jgi:hypothetical protein